MVAKKGCGVERISKLAGRSRSHIAFIGINSFCRNILRKNAASTFMYASGQRPCWQEYRSIHPSRSFNRSIAALLTSVLFLFSLAACSDKQISEEDQIKYMVERAVTAAEKKELGALIDVLTESYSDKYNKTRKQAGKMLRLYFFRNKSIHLFTRIKSIEILDDTAQQTDDADKRAILQIYVGLAGRPVKGDSPLGLRADLLLFTMDLIKDDDDWLVEKSDWKRASQDDL